MVSADSGLQTNSDGERQDGGSRLAVTSGGRGLGSSLWLTVTTRLLATVTKVGIPNFVSGPREYIMGGRICYISYVFMAP